MSSRPLYIHLAFVAGIALLVGGPAGALQLQGKGAPDKGNTAGVPASARAQEVANENSRVADQAGKPSASDAFPPGLQRNNGGVTVIPPVEILPIVVADPPPAPVVPVVPAEPAPVESQVQQPAPEPILQPEPVAEQPAPEEMLLPEIPVQQPVSVEPSPSEMLIQQPAPEEVLSPEILLPPSFEQASAPAPSAVLQPQATSPVPLPPALPLFAAVVAGLAILPGRKARTR